MTEVIKIAVDAMGGDGSPKKIIDGINPSFKYGFVLPFFLSFPGIFPLIFIG